MQDVITFLSHHAMLGMAIFAVFILLTILELIRAKRRAISLSPAEATQKINRDHAVVIDVRPKDTYRTGHIIDAQCLSADEIQDNPKKVERFRTKPLIIVCQAGTGSQKIAALLLKRGYNASSLAGGMRAWIDAQMPVVKE